MDKRIKGKKEIMMIIKENEKKEKSNISKKTKKIDLKKCLNGIQGHSIW